MNNYRPRCPYYDCGWCYHSNEDSHLSSNDDNGKCNNALGCTVFTKYLKEKVARSVKADLKKKWEGEPVRMCGPIKGEDND